MGRQDITGKRLAELTGESEFWVGRRLRNKTQLTLDDLDVIAAALGVGIRSLLPGLDSNQKPAGYRPESRSLRAVG